MTPELWIALAAANFVAYLAPGQNMDLVGAATARSGLPGGMAAVGGILVAEAAWTGIALGLTLTVRGIDSNLLLSLQVVSGAFLVWSGWKVLTSSEAFGRAPGSVPPHGVGGRAATQRGAAHGTV